METERSGVKNKQTEAGARMQVDGCRKERRMEGDDCRVGSRKLRRRVSAGGRDCQSRGILDHLLPPHPM
jgi:hypothetical protein